VNVDCGAFHGVPVHFLPGPSIGHLDGLLAAGVANDGKFHGGEAARAHETFLDFLILFAYQLDTAMIVKVFVQLPLISCAPVGFELKSEQLSRLSCHVMISLVRIHLDNFCLGLCFYPNFGDPLAPIIEALELPRPRFCQQHSPRARWLERFEDQSSPSTDTHLATTTGSCVPFLVHGVL